MTEQPPYDPNATGGTPPPPPGYGAPPPPGGGYGAPPPGYGPPGGYGPPPGTNQKAIWGLVCAIVGFCCFPVAIAGIILGNQAKNETAQTGQAGNGMAQAAFIVGIVALAVNLLGTIIRFSS